MDKSFKQVFLEDIQESIEQYTQDKKFLDDYVQKEKERISIYAELERRLSDSPNDERLRLYIKRQLEKWQRLLREQEKKLAKANEGLEYLSVMKSEIEKRKDDLS